jgi:hypothetical protein
MTKQQTLDALAVSIEMNNRPLSKEERAQYTVIEDKMQFRIKTLLEESAEKEMDIKIDAMEQLLALVKPKTNGQKGK